MSYGTHAKKIEQRIKREAQGKPAPERVREPARRSDGRERAPVGRRARRRAT